MAWQTFAAYQGGDVRCSVWEEDDKAPAPLDVNDLIAPRRERSPFLECCELIFPLPEGASLSDEEAAEACSQWLGISSGADADANFGFYYDCTGPLVALLRPPFLRAHIAPARPGDGGGGDGDGGGSGGFFAIAAQASAYLGNTFAITPDGKLTLLLDRETFQALGVPAAALPRNAQRAGTPGGGRPVRYRAVIDLTAPSFRPGKGLYDRLLVCLAEDRVGPVRMVAARCRGDPAAATLSAGEVEFPPGFATRRVPLLPVVKILRDVCVPSLDWSRYEGDGNGGNGAAGDDSRNGGRSFSSDQNQTAGGGGGGGGGGDNSAPRKLDGRAKGALLLDLFEWLGAASCGLRTVLRRTKVDPFLSSFATPRHLHFHPNRDVVRVRFAGLVPLAAVSRLIERAMARCTASLTAAATADSAAAAGLATDAAGVGAVRAVGGDSGDLGALATAPLDWAAVMAWSYGDAMALAPDGLPAAAAAVATAAAASGGPAEESYTVFVGCGGATVGLMSASHPGSSG